MPLVNFVVTVGKSIATRMAMMAMTTSNSIKVNPAASLTKGLRSAGLPMWDDGNFTFNSRSAHGVTSM